MEDEEGGGGGHGSSERWLVSYADFITLLFALFVFLYAMSQASLSDRSTMARSVARAIGLRPMMGDGIAALPGDPTEFQRLAEKQLEAARQNIIRSLQRFKDSGVSVRIDERGLVVSLSAARFFGSGDATIDPQQLPVLDEVTEVISKLPNLMRIEGFTDSMPISNAYFADNWDLSAARAGAVLRFILAHSSIPPEHVCLAGYGPYNPVASNDSEGGRALNRRVEIIVMRRADPSDQTKKTASNAH